MILLAIDPGNEYSGYVVVEAEDDQIIRVLDKGKTKNKHIIAAVIRSKRFSYTDIAIEMIASYGMPVGASAFDTCVWIGRFWQAAREEYDGKENPVDIKNIYRKDEKMEICGTQKAKDSNIRQALVDLYAPNTPNGGKGYKAEPGFFYGFRADIWQAFAVAHTYVQKYGF